MITIRKLKPKDTRAAATLISETYSVFNFREGDAEAVRRYIDCYGPNRPLNELEYHFGRSSNSFVAADNGVIAGVIRGTYDRIINLYVAKKYHRQGVATKLVRRFEREALRHGTEKIYISASLYAVPFYQAVGYKKTTGIRRIRGLQIQPMKKVLV